MENQNFSSFKSLKKDSPQSQMASVGGLSQNHN